MTRQGSRAVRRHRIIVGVLLSVVTFGVLLPITFVLLSKWLDMTLGFPPLTSEDIATIVAAFCIFVGILWITWAYSYLVFIGKGSPVEAFGMALEPTQALVTFGPYAYLRHPMTFGILWVLVGTAFYIRSISGLILIPILALAAWAHIVIWEEKGLERRFGAEYKRYRENVPALIPRLKPYEP
ncbi:MAG: isoprenylcysteine carboxylmethyltransferase family protein [Armatimonadota bacterium]|nr:isoprenylcysteine carboxylmethyltransferase family protein [Armatimonadota bacterium]